MPGWNTYLLTDSGSEGVAARRLYTLAVCSAGVFHARTLDYKATSRRGQKASRTRSPKGNAPIRQSAAKVFRDSDGESYVTMASVPGSVGRDSAKNASANGSFVGTTIYGKRRHNSVQRFLAQTRMTIPDSWDLHPQQQARPINPLHE